MSAWKPSVFGRFTISSSSTSASSCACRPSRSRLRRRAARRSCFGDIAGLAERVGDLLRVAGGILRPLRRARGRIDADDAVLADAEVAQLLADRAGLAHLGQEVLRSSSLPIAEPPPVGGQTGATSDPTTRFLPRILSASLFRSSSVESMLTCGSNRNRSTPSNLTPFDFALRPSCRASCRDRSAARRPGRPCRPGPATSRCEALGICAGPCASLSGRSYASVISSRPGCPDRSASGCTSGSVSLRFSTRTPAFAASAVTNSFVFRHLSEADHRRRRHRQLPNVPYPCVRMRP